jgi:dTDP-4-dehydrorhamnose 3,5-epimerase
MYPRTAPDPPASVFPPGVSLRPLEAHEDERGLVAELFRLEWPEAFAPAQWSFTVSAGGVLRGVHMHPRHTDWLVILDGRCWIGLYDPRRGSPGFGRSCLFAMDGAAPAALCIPPGVLHGLCFPERCTYVLGADCVYDLADELGCHWSDPALGIDWPLAQPLLSERDAALPSLADLAQQVPAFAGAS